MNEVTVKYKSIHKAITVLNCFTKKRELGVTEICEQLGYNKSNVHDILQTFRAMDYLDQDETTGKYHLGRGIFALCRALGDTYSITKIAMPYMQEISNLTGERTYIGIPLEEEVFYLDAAYPAGNIQLVRTLMGERAKLYCTGIGKAMLAFMPRKEQDKLLENPLEAYTENTITDPEKLREELALIRLKGYSVDNMEHEYGVKCVAVPIFLPDRKIYAAISVSGPSLRFEGEEKERYLAEIIKKYVREIEQRL